MVMKQLSYGSRYSNKLAYLQLITVLVKGISSPTSHDYLNLYWLRESVLPKSNFYLNL